MSELAISVMRRERARVDLPDVAHAVDGGLEPAPQRGPRQAMGQPRRRESPIAAEEELRPVTGEPGPSLTAAAADRRVEMAASREDAVLLHARVEIPVRVGLVDADQL